MSKDVFSSYEISNDTFDEFEDCDGNIRHSYEMLKQQFSSYNNEDFEKLNEEAKLIFFNEGITFAVYSENEQGGERIFPFDLIPRVIPQNEWEHIEKGVIQRNLAINMFIKDLYTEKQILKDKVVPADLIHSSSNLNAQMEGIVPAGGIYNHISGTDIIRHSDGHYYVLEDNVRCPSGVSYVLANRQTLKKTFPRLFNRCKVKQVHDYPQRLLEMLQSVAPAGVDTPTCAVMTPGMYNSAYYEHSFLAQSMGIRLVEGRDLFVENNFVYMKTIHGNIKVDVIYRRLDDPFIDPLVYNKDSLLGTPGLMAAYREGNVTLVNAPGTGVSDDKAVYTYVPEIIKYYLNEEPILRNVHTYRCEKDEDFEYVLNNIESLVIKPVDESGGYGISVGNTLSPQEIERVKMEISADRRKYIAQPIMSLSTHPTFIDETETVEPRHIDLRTYCLLGKNYQYVVPGGLTRVALKRGNLIVNSSQGGGSKDTWVV
ncbi:MAG: circularly permuted type 2 ATP-grasp protein [Lentisphaeraceae bacterium]|nr:circularly permuted type 2 ATP-grasp protein [Lentisphaeraceae bacterium]